MKHIVLDSTPLGLLTHRSSAAQAVVCREWYARKTAQGIGAIVPEIVDYELRRELLRAGKTASIGRLDYFLSLPTVTYLPITTAGMKLAASLWAQSRRAGKPTSDQYALDIDVILCAQVMAAGYQPEDFIVATANVRHLTQFVPADLWTNI